MNYSILTFNIRIDRKIDGEHRLQYRIPLILEKLKKLSPSIICFQEIKKSTENILKNNLTSYNYIGLYRDDSSDAEANFIFYKTNLFEKVSDKTLWLSNTPTKKGSRYEKDQSPCPRIMSILKLKTMDNKTLNIINTHLDHEGQNARECASSQIIDYIKTNLNNNEPLILCGDFNALPNDLAIKNITNVLKDTTVNIKHTFHCYGNSKENIKIDYIFINKLIKDYNAIIIKSDIKGKYLSDHHPIKLDFII